MMGDEKMDRPMIEGLYPVGYVVSEWHRTDKVQVGDQLAVIKVCEEYLPALHRINEHSHFWILSWFHEAKRSILRVKPMRINPDLPEYGVFGLRTPSRPNPIALTLVRLIKIENNELHVSGLDAIDGTPVLDIKPYFESDIVFSPQTSYIVPQNDDMRRGHFRKQAFMHHGEVCSGLELGVEMALLAEDYFGKIQDSAITITIQGDACVADVLQGLTRARLANPARFHYIGQDEKTEVCWRRGEQAIMMRQHPETGKVVITELRWLDGKKTAKGESSCS